MYQKRSLKTKLTEKITFPRWPSEFPANLCRPVCLGGLTGRHWLAGNSEGHRGISKFLFLMVPYKYYGALATGIREVAFFYHLKSQSYIVICLCTYLSFCSKTVFCEQGFSNLKVLKKYSKQILSDSNLDESKFGHFIVI